MSQPFLDLMNYDCPATPADFGGDMQDFLCNAPKTDGRFGFNPAAVDRQGHSLWEKGLKTVSTMIAAQRLFGGQRASN